MPHFLYGIARGSARSTLRSLFKPRETQSASLSDDVDVLYVSSHGELDRTGSVFTGHAIDHTDRSVVFPGAGPSQLPSAGDLLEGCYFRAERRNGAIHLGTDLFGMKPLFITNGPTAVMASDSLYVLTRARRALGLSNTLDETAYTARLWLNALAQQPLSARTPVQEISFCVPGTMNSADLTTWEVERRHRPLRDLIVAGVTNHEQAVRESARRMIGLLTAFRGGGVHLDVALSGGLDSRVVLAAVLATGDLSDVSVTSQRAGSVDHDIACRLGSRFGFDVNSRHPDLDGTVERADAFANWTVASLGLYDGLYSPRSYRIPPRHIVTVGGHGAEAAKGTFGWRTIAAVDMPEATREAAEEGLHDLGIEVDDPIGTHWHYIGYRNGVHGSRGNWAHDLVSRPVMQQQLVGLSTVECNQLRNPRRHAPSIVSDLLAVLSPDLAVQDFDTQRKNLSFAEVTERLRALGGPVDVSEAPGYRVHGTPAKPRGLTKSFAAMAMAEGLKGVMTPQSLAPKLALAAERHDLDLGPVASEIGTLEDSRTDVLPASSRPATAVGKSLIPLLVG